jgi:tryptophan halogenase
MNDSKKIVIVGGGTAGWLTALIVKKAFPNASIDLVESSQIGILGAGEGATPHFLSALEYADITLKDLISNTSSTIKNGILFDGWSKNREAYIHGFGVHDGRFRQDLFNNSVTNFDFTSAPMLQYLAEYNQSAESDLGFLTNLSLKNKTLFRKENGQYAQHGIYAVHFDAKSLAEYMAKVARERGVKRIEGKVQDIYREESGNISHLVLDNGREVRGEFFFDCTGFARLIIGKMFESEWVSFKDSLPAKRAMPFFLDPDKDSVQPYTHAKAMDRGWVWKIPLQHRYGCGYVYDPDQISDEEVKLEIDQFAGKEVEIPRIFNFEPGYYKRVWIKNCLALGLSNGFVEPLEATSIMQLLFALQTLLSQRHKMFSDDEVFKENYNRQIEEDHLDIESFIYLHYMTDKDNNDFWANFTKNYKMPDRLVPTVERIKHGILNMRDNTGIFDINSHLVVARGNGLLERENVEQIYEASIKHLEFDRFLSDIAEDIQSQVGTMADHAQFLIDMGGTLGKR